MEINTDKKKGFINWTDEDNLQLVGAVMKVEVEMMSEWKKASQHPVLGKRVRKWTLMRSPTEKWSAVADLLPVELQGKTGICRTQTFNALKLYARFRSLLTGYRQKAAGKARPKLSSKLTNTVCTILKKRDDYINCCTFSVSDNGLRLGNASSKDTLNRSSHRHGSQWKQILATSNNSLLNTSTSHPQMRAFKNVPIDWTEADRVQLVRAVIQVEKEIMSGLNQGGRCSTDNRKGKWERIANLLRPGLRERTLNSRNGTRASRHKCRFQFFNLISPFRARLARKASKRSCNKALTEPVLKLLKEREELLNSRRLVLEKSSLISGRSKSVDTSEVSHHNERQLSLNLSNCLKGQASSSVREEGAARSSDSTPEGETSGEYQNLESDGEKRTDADHEESIEQPSHSSRASRSVDETKNKPIFASQNVNQSRPQTRAQSKANIKDSASVTTRPPTQGQPSFSKRKYNDWETRPNSDRENVQGTLGRSLRRIDVEFSSLSSWVQNQWTPAALSAVNEIMRSETRPSKFKPRLSGHRARRVSETWAQVDHISSKRTIDSQIQSSFEQVRIQFVKQLGYTAEDLATKVLKEARFLSNVRR